MSETTLREASATLPKKDNAGQTTTWVHASFAQRLVDRFGGYSCFDVRGFWRDDRGEFYDESVRYVVALETHFGPDETIHFADFRTLAIEAGREAGQTSVYIVAPDGRAEIANV